MLVERNKEVNPLTNFRRFFIMGIIKSKGTDVKDRLFPKSDVTVIDAKMGKGKTSWAIQHINTAPEDEKFIYITPYLSEIERVKDSVTAREMIEPEEKGKTTKSAHLKELLEAECDIVATHSLFTYVGDDSKDGDGEILDLLYFGNYTLILDEVLNVIEEKQISKSDYEQFFMGGNPVFSVDKETNQCILVKEDYSGIMEDLKLLALSGNLYKSHETLLYWLFPEEVFEVINKVFLLTYMFEGQSQKLYYDMAGISYNKRSVDQSKDGTYFLTDFTDYVSKEEREELKSLITIYEGKYNRIGDTLRAKRGTKRKNPLSVSQLSNTKKNKSTAYRKLGNTMKNYFDTYLKKRSKLNNVDPNNIIWTTFKRFKDDFKRSGFSDKNFVSINARATNQYQDKSVVVYMADRYMSPDLSYILYQRGVKLTKGQRDTFALSELLQFVFRSRIRNGQPIELFLPSERMRTLLTDFLNGDFTFHELTIEAGKDS